jgi:hypothetical protein
VKVKLWSLHSCSRKNDKYRLNIYLSMRKRWEGPFDFHLSLLISRHSEERILGTAVLTIRRLLNKQQLRRVLPRRIVERQRGARRRTSRVGERRVHAAEEICGGRDPTLNGVAEPYVNGRGHHLRSHVTLDSRGRIHDRGLIAGRNRDRLRAPSRGRPRSRGAGSRPQRARPSP